MDGWVDRWIDGWMNGGINVCMDGGWQQLAFHFRGSDGMTWTQLPADVVFRNRLANTTTQVRQLDFVVLAHPTAIIVIIVCCVYGSPSVSCSPRADAGYGGLLPP